MDLDPGAKVQDLSVGEQQRVEILKVLYRGSDVIVLDEPTQVLTPGERNDLFETLRRLVKNGRTIVFITHHLEEVMSLSDRVTVLRRGRVVASVATRDADTATLANLMVGRDLGSGEKRTDETPGDVILDIRRLTSLSNRHIEVLHGVEFEIRRGEILGLAGVEGNGQRELVEVLTGLRTPTGGTIRIGGQVAHRWTPRQFLEAGVAMIPEDRRVRGLVEPFTIAENLALGRHRSAPFSKRGLLDLGAMNGEARRLIDGPSDARSGYRRSSVRPLRSFQGGISGGCDSVGFLRPRGDPGGIGSDRRHIRGPPGRCSSAGASGGRGPRSHDAGSELGMTDMRVHVMWGVDSA